MSRFSSFGSSNNPMFNKVSNTNSSGGQVIDSHMLGYGIGARQLMTAKGAVNKTLLLFGILVVAAVVNWNLQSHTLFVGGSLAGIACVFAIMFKPNWAMYLAPVYSVGKGFAVGAISSFFAAKAGDYGFVGSIAFQALTITMSLLFVMLMTYKAGWIKLSEKFRAGVMMATMGMSLIYVVMFLASLMGSDVPFPHEMGTLGIGICSFAIVLGCLNFLIDFDFFEEGERSGLPKSMEWYAALSLLTTMVWMYLHVIQLLSLLGDND